MGGVQEIVAKDFESEQEVLQTTQQIREESMEWRIQYGRTADTEEDCEGRK